MCENQTNYSIKMGVSHVKPKTIYILIFIFIYICMYICIFYKSIYILNFISILLQLSFFFLTRLLQNKLEVISSVFPKAPSIKYQQRKRVSYKQKRRKSR